MSRQKYDLAIENYDRAAEANPKSASVIQQRAVARKLAGELEGAIDDFATVLDMNPDNASAWMGRGYVRFQLKYYEKAVADFGLVVGNGGRG